MRGGIDQITLFRNALLFSIQSANFFYQTHMLLYIIYTRRAIPNIYRKFDRKTTPPTISSPERLAWPGRCGDATTVDLRNSAIREVAIRKKGQVHHVCVYVTLSRACIYACIFIQGRDPFSCTRRSC